MDSKKMTLEELEAAKERGDLPFELLMDWAQAKADSENKATHVVSAPVSEQDDTEQHEVNILDD